MGGLKVGIDLGGTKMLLLCDQDGKKIEQRVPTGMDFGQQCLKESIIGFLKDLSQRPSLIGVAVPGLIDGEGRIQYCDVLPKLEGLKDDFLKDLGIQAYFLNDVEAGLVEEASALPADASMAMVMVGTGVGMAAKINGTLLKGAQGWAGELGKVPMYANGEIKILDDLASGASIISKLGIGIEEINQRLSEGHVPTVQCIWQAGKFLGMAVATLVNTLNPELIVLGGGTTGFPGYYEEVLKTAEQCSLPDLWKCCTLRKPLDSKRVVALGAMRHATECSRM